MQKTAAINEKSIQTNYPYRDAWEHLFDEFALLDLRIQYLLAATGAGKDTANNFKGLMLTAEEIQPLLHKSLSYNTRLPQEAKALLREITGKSESIKARLALSREQGIFLPLEHLVRVFNLSDFEKHAVLVSLAFELDRKYEKIYAYLQDDINCKYPTVDMVINLLCYSTADKMAARFYFSEKSKLNRFFFRKEEDAVPRGSSLARALILEERLVNFIVNPDFQEDNIFSYIKMFYPDEELEPLIVGQGIQTQIRTFLDNYFGEDSTVKKNVIFYLHGPAGAGKKLQARHFGYYYNQPLMFVDLKSMAAMEQHFTGVIEQICREAVIRQAVLCVQHFDVLTAADETSRKNLQKLVDGISLLNGVVFLLSETAWKPQDLFKDYYYIDIELSWPTDTERVDLWELWSAAYRFNGKIDWASLAGKFRFTPGQIKDTLATAAEIAGWLHPEGAGAGPEEIYRACYTQIKNKMSSKATRINPQYVWDDLILPPKQKEQLKIACNQMKYRYIVYGKWGFGRKLSYGKGLSMLFSGPPGTGKTISAQVVARELYLELYKIDLSQIVSKYIGETEKNLNEIFREAGTSNAILFFDETDALFGKRSEVKDSHDRYANIETAFLLQKVEEYEGITVLATNFLQNIDEAFLRRISFIIEFPFPDPEYRTKLWQSMFPPETPLDEDIDFDFLGKKFELAGGNIKNIAVAAAFLAAEHAEPVKMKHIIKSAQYEMQKMGKILLRQDLGEYASLLTV